MSLDPQSPKDRYIIDYILKHEQRYDYYAVPIVLMEDAQLHTADNNYRCDEPSCPCHTTTEDDAA